jgi:thiol-disulfide isomerase/thioredoxin
MPFGLVFGAVVFAVLCLWRGLSAAIAGPDLPARIGGTILIVLGVSLSLGLLNRQSLARWTGVVAAALLAVRAAVRMMHTGQVLDHVIFIATVGTFVLLILPVTGDVRRGLEPAPSTSSGRSGRGLGMIAVIALTGLFGVSVWAWMAREATAGFGLPRLEWNEFAPGLEQARLEDKPVLIDFYADWCGPCKTMDRKTFRNPAVVEKLSGEIVSVRVDSEETVARNGYSGVELAERYSVLSYPTLMILDGQGRVLSRKTGFLNARQLLTWVDETLADTEVEAKDPDDAGFAL